MTLNKQQDLTNEVEEFNTLLKVVAKSIQFGLFRPKEAIELENRIKLSGLKILVLKVNIHGIPNIDGFSDMLLEPLQNQLESFRKEKLFLIKQYKYEEAAILRDQEQNVINEISTVIQDDLKLVDGFNYYDNSLLIVHPKNAQKRMAMKSLLQNLGMSTDEPLNDFH